MNQTNKSQQQLKVLLADDHALVRGGLALLIEMAIGNAEILQANSLQQVTELLSKPQDLDLMLLDLMMPGMDDLKGIKTISSLSPSTPIIIVSVKEDTNSIKGALASGAMGYIPKTSSPDVTMSAIQLVLTGGIYVPPHILQQQENVLYTKAPSTPLSNLISSLSKRQIQVIDLIVLGNTNQEIADQLSLSMPTVKMHVSGILKKLDVKSRSEAVAIYSGQKNAKQLH